MQKLIERLEQGQLLSEEEFVLLLTQRNQEFTDILAEKARFMRSRYYGNKVFVRGLIEFTNYCKNDCYYCGIRCSNKRVTRYRLSRQEILSCCQSGYELGFRTFVLQGGEDPLFREEDMIDLISAIRETYPDCAITLSFGEKDASLYQKYFDAGANRYLLRHETADPSHYSQLHPSSLTLQHRMDCLFALKEIGFQVGCGFMVGSPFQTIEHLAKDLYFIQTFRPHMVGIGPFLPHHDTPFAAYPGGSFELTLFLLSCVRLILPNVLLPSTTALGTVHPDGRESGILAGANVVMPNLSPLQVRENYLLYDNKICTGDEAAESLANLTKKMQKIGYAITIDRGDFRP